MATKLILEGARSFKMPGPPPADAGSTDHHHWRWPSWPARLSLRRKDKYLIDIRPGRSLKA